MKILPAILLISLSFYSSNILAQQRSTTTTHTSPDDLETRYKADWNKQEYAAEKAAEKETYLTNKEKKIYYYLNLVRMNPQLFASTYVAGYKDAYNFGNNENIASLIADLNKLQKLPTLLPSKKLYANAKCQATAIGQKSITGMGAHNRKATGCSLTGSYAENINFGKLTPLAVVMSWLIDANNVLGPNDLGHRKNCLDPSWNIMGLSVQPHKAYGECVVLDMSVK